MLVLIGNPHAVETFMDGETLRYRDMGAGERTTTLVLPDELSLVDAVNTINAALDRHLAKGVTPAWIEVEDYPELEVLLADQWRLPEGARKKPQGWGDPNFRPNQDAAMASAAQEG